MNPPAPFMYNLENPISSFKLSKELKEISGITVYDKDRLLAVQDEDAILFVLSLSSGSITEALPFGEKGDYEAVAYDGHFAYVLRSDAVIFALSPQRADSLKVIKIETTLDKSYDTEGLCFDKKNNRLLIACKQSGSGNPDLRNIYEYRLDSKTFNPKPVFTLTNEMLKDFLKRMPASEEQFNFVKEWEFNNSKIFIYPSDIAVHPISNDIYISSARGINCILVLSSDGNIKSLKQIPKSLLSQPEGICFTEDGLLVLSSEGKAKKERLFVFKPN